MFVTENELGLSFGLGSVIFGTFTSESNLEERIGLEIRNKLIGVVSVGKFYYRNDNVTRVTIVTSKLNVSGCLCSFHRQVNQVSFEKWE